jgi:predicted dehydrogenase/threonine dehydrogenase-like Zn-dependent dehydrogenase
VKQLIHDLRSGELILEEIPAPQTTPGSVRVRTVCSIISAGTERTKIEMGNKSLLQKALARPDLVRKLADRARREGIRKAIQTAQTRLAEPAALGYSCAGEVIDLGSEVSGIRVGDRVACAGAGYANHCEINVIPQNLVVPIPDDLSYEQAAFTTLGSIALQGVRLSRAVLGERVAVIGLGLVGQLAVRILKAAGCLVVGVDIDPESIRLASSSADLVLNSREGNVSAGVESFTDGYGVDATLIAASTVSDDPVITSGEITREKGRVVVLGAVGMNIPREAYYHKEIEVVVSRSYGPGRYDATYEEGGIDYPFPYVRFTERRNMQTVLDLMADGLDVTPLVTDRYPFSKAVEAYSRLTDNNAERPFGIILQYGNDAIESDASVTLPVQARRPVQGVGVSVIGAGNYATATLLPTLSKHPKVSFRRICSASGLSAKTAGARFGFQEAVTGSDSLIGEAETDLIVIATRHDSHASCVVAALEAGKHVYVEKPLCLTRKELATIEAAESRAAARGQTLTVGFNRRLSSFTSEVSSFFSFIASPRVVQIRVNAGSLPTGHWQKDPHQGGGRILGEVCHFLDLACFLVGRRPISLTATGSGKSTPQLEEDLVIALAFEDGSVGNIVYTSQGDARFPKERVEVFSGGAVAVIDDFVSAQIISNGKTRKLARKDRDKGQTKMLTHLIDGLVTGSSPIFPFPDLAQSARLPLLVIESLASGRKIDV